MSGVSGVNAVVQQGLTVLTAELALYRMMHCLHYSLASLQNGSENLHSTRIGVFVVKNDKLMLAKYSSTQSY